MKLSLPMSLCLNYSYSLFFFRISSFSSLQEQEGRLKVKIVGVYQSRILTFFSRSSIVKSLLSFFRAANFSFFTQGYDSASDLLLDIKDLSWFIELLFLISESFWVRERYLRVEGTLYFDLALLLGLLLLFLLRFEQFQIFLGVLLVLLCDQPALHYTYSFGVFTFPSTTTKLPSIYDWDVLVPLMGALSLLKPFLLSVATRTSPERSGLPFESSYSSCFLP